MAEGPKGVQFEEEQEHALKPKSGSGRIALVNYVHTAFLRRGVHLRGVTEESPRACMRFCALTYVQQEEAKHEPISSTLQLNLHLFQLVLGTDLLLGLHLLRIDNDHRLALDLTAVD